MKDHKSNRTLSLSSNNENKPLTKEEENANIIKKVNDTVKILSEKDPFISPNCFVGKLVLNSSERNTLGTGFLISDNCVLTLAQNIVDENKEFERKVLSPDSVLFTPSSLIESNCFGEINVEEIFIPHEYELNENNFDSFNYAILRLKEPIGLKIKKILKKENNFLDSDVFSKSLLNLPLILVGFNIEEESPYRLYSTHEGTFQKIQDHKLEFKLNNQVLVEKGSPIFLTLQDRLFLIGMHINYDSSSKINCGYKITLTLANLIQKKVSNFQEKDLQSYYDLYGNPFIY